MKQNEPFLAGFSKQLYGKTKRGLQAAMQKLRVSALRDSLSGYAQLFDDVLPAEFLAAADPTLRNRHFGHRPVFWAWVGQILEQNASCSRALGLIQAWSIKVGLRPPVGDTSAYCKARGRVKESFLQEVHARTVGHLQRRVRSCDRWHGFDLKAFDGSSTTLMDTPANQSAYPQPSSQKEGCGFPVLGMVGLLNLSHGGWEAFATGPGTMHDARGAQRLVAHLGEGDLVLADRAFCSFELVARTLAQGAQCVMRLHQARHRKLDWRRGVRISPVERLVVWEKPVKQPATSDLSAEAWAALPDELTLRYIKMGYEDRGGQKRMLVVVTTLLDPREHEAEEVIELYVRRWDIELKFRDLKTTLGMERLAVQSPEMARKTVLMMMIAFNLLRTLMQKAAYKADRPLAEMSFKGILDVLVSSHDLFLLPPTHHRKRRARRDQLVEICATKLLDIRPFRTEPRAVKRRPKSYQLLTKPRHVFRENPHRGKYRRAA